MRGEWLIFVEREAIQDNASPSYMHVIYDELKEGYSFQNILHFSSFCREKRPDLMDFQNMLLLSYSIAAP